MFDLEVQQRLNEIAELWNIVEKRLKHAERISSEVVVGAINELRYAGRLVIDVFALAANTSITLEDKKRQIDGIITEIKNNCIRANADITDALVLYFHLRLDDFVEQFGRLRIMRLFPDYSRMRQAIRKTNEFMAKSRGDRLQRRDIYETLRDEYLPRIEDLYNSMVEVENPLREELLNEGAMQRLRDYWAEYGFYLGGAGVLLAIVALWVSVAAAFHWPPFP